jgi:hypothetical protein
LKSNGVEEVLHLEPKEYYNQILGKTSRHSAIRLGWRCPAEDGSMFFQWHWHRWFFSRSRHSRSSSGSGRSHSSCTCTCRCGHACGRW